GEIKRGWLGVVIGDFVNESDEAREKYGKDMKGAYVASVGLGPAGRAGLAPGDVIVSYDGKKVNSAELLRHMVAETAVGKCVEVRVVRIRDDKAQSLTADIVIGKQPK
ncbi:MAG: PDZ domain-containing protein, partial [Planctomycetes bacterium]|nr:PDZ domain-containing protein [Planctomycetota bacterium]